MSLKEALLKEINPKYDLEGIDWKKAKGEISQGKGMRKSLETHALYVYKLPKMLVRGATVGGIVGLFVGMVSDAPTSESARTGAIVGATIDYCQYSFRNFALYLKSFS